MLHLSLEKESKNMNQKLSKKHSFLGSASEATSDLLIHKNKCAKRKQFKISEIT
jgi:hypothetical protein